MKVDELYAVVGVDERDNEMLFMMDVGPLPEHGREHCFVPYITDNLAVATVMQKVLSARGGDYRVKKFIPGGDGPLPLSPL